MKVLVTGGCGFIGATISSCLEDNGYTPVILDDLSTGRREFARDRAFYEGDYADPDVLSALFVDHPDIEVVIHCAAKIIVPESTRLPLEYYRNNVAKGIEFLQFVVARGVTRFIFSSTASLYEPAPGELMVSETSPTATHSPYSATKWMFEKVLSDTAATGELNAIALRYFNPIGADPFLRTGLQALHPTHALGKILEALREHTPFTVTGTEWDTRDGSGLRDYVHVWDLARAHVMAIGHFDDVMTDAESTPTPGFSVINLGTGTGTTVLELVRASERVAGTPIDVIYGPSRPGDVIGCAPTIDKARKLLGWEPGFSLEQGIDHALQWSVIYQGMLASV